MLVYLTLILQFTFGTLYAKKNQVFHRKTSHLQLPGITLDYTGITQRLQCILNDKK